MRWDLFFRPLPLAAVVPATLAAALLWRRRGRRSFVPGPGRSAPQTRSGAHSTGWSAILGVHVAVPLLFNGVQGNLFSPDNALPSPWSNFLGLAETGVALSLFYGGFARVSAVVLAVLWAIGVPLLGFQSMLDNVLFLGFGAFFLAGRGPISVDRMLFPRLEPPDRLPDTPSPPCASAWA